jgi:hypothetical protein
MAQVSEGNYDADKLKLFSFRSSQEPEAFFQDFVRAGVAFPLQVLSP